MCDDDRFGSLEVYALRVMLIGLKARECTRLHNVREDDKLGSLEVLKFTCWM